MRDWAKESSKGASKLMYGRNSGTTSSHIIRFFKRKFDASYTSNTPHIRLNTALENASLS